MPNEGDRGEYPVAVMGSFTVLFLGLVSVALLLIAGTVVAGMLRATRQRLAPQESAEARVVEKRTEVTGGGEMRVHQRYYVTFEFPDGRRLELSVPTQESGTLVTGDRGTLSWQGTRYLGFARQIMR